MKLSFERTENMETNGQKLQNICLAEQTIILRITLTRQSNGSLKWKKNQISISIFNQEFSQLLERIFPSEILILVNCKVSLTNLKALTNQFGFEFWTQKIYQRINVILSMILEDSRLMNCKLLNFRKSSDYYLDWLWF